MDEWKRFAQRRRPGGADRADRSARARSTGSTRLKASSPRISRRPRASSTTSRSAGSRPPRRRARRRRRCGTAIDRPPIRSRRRRASSSRCAARSGRANLALKLALIERAEALARVDRLDQDRRRAEEAAGRVAGDRTRAAPGHAGDMEAVPRGVRHVLHAPQRRSGRAQGNLGGQPGQERSALRARRGARGLDGVGARRRARFDGSRPTGRRSARCAATSRR